MLSPPLALFKEDLDAEAGVYVVSQEKLEAFLANRAGSVATSRAAEAIANLTVSGEGPEEDKILDDQYPHFKGKSVFPPRPPLCSAHGIDTRAVAGHVQSYT
jgi:hypothetical protein